MKSYLFTCIIALLTTFQYAQAQTVTGLDGFSIFLDPGHSETENMGLYNYSEPEKVLRVGLALRDMLLTQTDIDTVYMSRTSDSQQVPLTQRDDLANATGADFYHSIHSNAGSNTQNNTLFLYGGWRSNGQTVEKTPNGGKDMGDIMETELTDAMRIPTIGNWADRNFYQGSNVENHSNQYPYLFVNRTTNMASVLSEAGFHTNSIQQQRNLNADWKRLEAQSFFWSILEYLGVERPPVGIAAGYITNADGAKTLNGINVQVGDTTYVTDSYESLFHKYSSESDELSNGFYYLDGLENGPTQLIVSGEGFYPDTLDINVIEDDFTFTDVALVSSVPPFVATTSVGEDNEINPGEDLIIEFSRSMNRSSVENALSLSPGADFSLTWTSNKKLIISTASFDFENSYTLKIDSTALDNSSYAHSLDGNGDGSQGDSFTLTFATGPVDIIPPAISDIRPTNTRLNELWPIISATFDEPLDTTLFDENTVDLSNSGYSVPGEIVYYNVGDRSVINFFPSERLAKSKNYTLTFSKSISDTVGNSLGSDVARTFPTGDQDIKNETVVDDFESGLTGTWWTPEQSGSTEGYDPEFTSVEIDNNIVNLFSESTGAMRINYGWDTDETSHLIREYRGSKTTPKFGADRILQVYVFGDGNGNKFRFMVRDGNGELEGSTWYTVDWLGWKLVTWNMAEDETVAWANGNGTLNGNLYLDSFQLTYTPGQPATGFILFDDLKAVEMGLATSTEESPVAADIPEEIELKQNYPNPFNPTTNISFGLPQKSRVDLKVFDMLGREVATVYSGVKAQGFHTVSFDASNLSSGVYLYRIETDFGVISKKMTLLK